MKKLTAIILAAALLSTSVLFGCEKKTTGQEVVDDKNSAKTEVKNDEKDDKNEETVHKEYITPVEAGDVSEFNQAIEEQLETIVSKNELDNEILLSVNGLPVSAAAVRYAVIACNSFYEGDTSEDVEQQKADEIDTFYRLNAAVITMANQYGVAVDDETFKSNLSDNYDFLKEQYGEELDSVIDSFTFQTPYFYFLNQYYNLLYSLIYEDFAADEEFAADVKTAVLKDMTESETPYVRAKHILICFPEEGEGENGEVTEAQKQETLNKANDVLARVNNGEDFDALVKECGEDPGMLSYPGGYYFTTGKMVPEFEETTFALAEGETSGLVETTYGYHIIQRLPLDDDAIFATDEYLAKGYELFGEILNASADNLEITFEDSYEGRYADFTAEYEALKLANQQSSAQ